MYIKRKLEAKIFKYLDSPEIIAVVGPRQCGKSTMLMKIFEGLENTAMVSFEDRTALTLFDRNIDDFVDVYVKNKKFLFIDEFQYAKNGGKKLKYIFRVFRHRYDRQRAEVSDGEDFHFSAFSFRL